MRIIVIEDDTALATLVQNTCLRAGLAVDLATTGMDALSFFQNFQYDAAILDLTLPDIDGALVLSDLRASGNNVPVLILTGNHDTSTMLNGFELGADDYLTKPFNTKELLARVTALIRRSAGFASNKITLGGVVHDLGTDVTSLNGKPLVFTEKEQKLFRLLALKKGGVAGRREIIEALYESGEEPEHNSVNVFIYRLRQKLEGTQGVNLRIKTLRGQGFFLEETTGA